jgi:hypothetical protein
MIYSRRYFLRLVRYNISRKESDLAKIKDAHFLVVVAQKPPQSPRPGLKHGPLDR